MSRFLTGLPAGGTGAPDARVGVLLVNLGTPDAPTPAAVRRYLREFLSDRRVIEMPAWLWQPILRAAILTRRPAPVAHKYAQIWLPEGSPLLVYSQALAQGLAQTLRARGQAVHVALAMRYGHPSIPAAFDQLLAAGCSRILVVPLYPQYAAGTTGTVVDAVGAHLARLRAQPTVRFMAPWPQAQAYIEALAARVRRHWEAVGGPPDRLLLSFHGLPQSCVRQGDPYQRHCEQTAAALRTALGEQGGLVHVAFQSRFGPAAWLQPATLDTLQAWGRAGVGRVDVLCPGFLADCLETLEEIDMQARQAFLAAGGGAFHYIACLNGEPDWVPGLAQLVVDELAGWLPAAAAHPAP